MVEYIAHNDKNIGSNPIKPKLFNKFNIFKFVNSKK